MPPFRMYLVLSLIFFVTAFFDPSEEFKIFYEDPNVELAETDESTPGNDEASESADQDSPDSDGQAEEAEEDDGPEYNVTFDGEDLDVDDGIISYAIGSVIPPKTEISEVGVPAAISRAIDESPDVIGRNVDGCTASGNSAGDGGVRPVVAVDAVLDEDPGGIPVGGTNADAPGIFPGKIEAYFGYLVVSVLTV